MASDPNKYSEAFLGKSNEEYCQWILNPDKWGGESHFSYAFLVMMLIAICDVGDTHPIICIHVLGYSGAIELSILAEYYGREIAAYDIQTTRCDLYGQVSLITLIDTDRDFPNWTSSMYCPV